jgi:hypothetical protein
MAALARSALKGDSKMTKLKWGRALAVAAAITLASPLFLDGARAQLLGTQPSGGGGTLSKLVGTTTQLASSALNQTAVQLLLHEVVLEVTLGGKPKVMAVVTGSGAPADFVPSFSIRERVAGELLWQSPKDNFLTKLVPELGLGGLIEPLLMLAELDPTEIGALPYLPNNEWHFRLDCRSVVGPSRVERVHVIFPQEGSGAKVWTGFPHANDADCSGRVVLIPLIPGGK